MERTKLERRICEQHNGNDAHPFQEYTMTDIPKRSNKGSSEIGLLGHGPSPDPQSLLYPEQFKRGACPYHISARRLRSLTRPPRFLISMLAYCYLVVVACQLIYPVEAVFINFQNCLSTAYQSNVPRALQFTPYFVDASFITLDSARAFKVTVYGNVSGSYDPQVTLPPANDSSWTNVNQTTGKIEDSPLPGTHYTTLFNKINVLTYEPWNENVRFCSRIDNATCPLAPRFYANPSDPYEFPSFSMSNNFYSSYALTTLIATFLIKDGDSNATPLGCISVDVTPDLGAALDATLRYVPLAVLISLGIATAFAAIFSPWGTSDTFKWTTNYGRDADLLRLVTPGFGDCLQYIQFVVLTGGLTLSYPGFYQPVVSQASWSALMFNDSFVSKMPGTMSLVDGIYVTNGTYGLQNLSQLVGMSTVQDIWAGMAVWLLVILGVTMGLIQVGFLCRWAYRHWSDIQEEDLRAKNMPFSVGNVIRIVFSYFLLPIVTLSMFQLMVTSSSPPFTVALAVVMLVAIVAFSGWLLYFVASTRPRSFLFDDLPTVLLYGSLYNTYSDDAAHFAFVPLFLTLARGIVIGAVQQSGIAQIVLLAIIEVINILTLHAFRPFHSPTSMNAYHTFFATVRFATILLMVSFAPSLGVTDGPKGWIGYAILLMHAIVLVFGFFLNALQTIVEVAARLAGAGGDESGAALGGFAKVFGMRQLSRRLDTGSRQSQLSSSAMMAAERNSNAGMVRIQSGSTGMLMNRRLSAGLDSAFDPNGGTSSVGATTPGEASAFSFLPSGSAGGAQNLSQGNLLNLPASEAPDPYYRAPRVRRQTVEASSSLGGKSHTSWTSGDWVKRWSRVESGTPGENPELPYEGHSISGRGTPVPPGHERGPDSIAADQRRSATDYTTREVDFYYRVRGPALNANVPSRRLKTGPQDPTSNVAVAGGWFRGLFGGKTKEKGKGFEVVRSSRMPPGMDVGENDVGGSLPEGIPIAATAVIRRDLDDDEPAIEGSPSASRREEEVAILDRDLTPLQSDEEFEMTPVPPFLPAINVGDGIGLPPDRIPYQSASIAPIPRKSSRRASPSSVGSGGRFGGSNASGQSGRLTSSANLSFAQRASSAMRDFPGDTYSDQPTTIGQVNNHPIRTVYPQVREGVDLLGSSAEIVDARQFSGSRQSYDEKR